MLLRRVLYLCIYIKEKAYDKSLQVIKCFFFFFFYKYRNLHRLCIHKKTRFKLFHTILCAAVYVGGTPIQCQCVCSLVMFRILYYIYLKKK